MRTAGRFGALSTAVVVGALVLSGAPAIANTMPVGFTCTGGSIPKGDYASITVTGVCDVEPDAVITVVGNVDVAAGASLDAQSVPSTITVGRNVTGDVGSYVGLGCQPPSATGNSAHECSDAPEGQSAITINGNVTVTNAVLVQLNGITVNGNVTLTGGGGAPYNYWSIKNNTIGRNLTMSGQTVNWLGVMFNEVGGNVTLDNITVDDEHPGAPGVYIVSNTVGRNLTCTRLAPGVSGGFIPGAVNYVEGNANGQCATLV